MKCNEDTKSNISIIKTKVQCNVVVYQYSVVTYTADSPPNVIALGKVTANSIQELKYSLYKVSAWNPEIMS